MATTDPRRRGARFRALVAPSGAVRVLVLFVSTVLLIGAAIAVVAWFHPPGNQWTLGAAAAAPHVLVGGVLALVGFVLARQWIGAGLAALTAAFLVATQAPAYVSADPPSNARDVTVLTANLHLGAADAASIVAEVKRRKVDVFMAEELTPEAVTRLRAAGLDDVLTHKLVRPSYAALGTGMWSRFPLETVSTPRLAFESVAARARIPGVAVRPTLAAVHPAGPVPDTTNWLADYRRLPGWLGGLPQGGATIVGGDFNATGSVAQFRDLLTGGYRDAAEQAGAGPLATYPADRWYPPAIGIDHVLTRSAVARSAETVDIADSDHRGVLVTVAVPRTS